MPNEIITITKFIYLKIYLRKTASRAIISEICLLRNFAFYNFCQNLSFQPLQEYWVTLQHFIIPWCHFYDKTSQKPWSQGYLQKKLQFTQLVYFPWIKDLTTSQALHWSIYDTSVSGKNLFTVYFKNLYFVKFCILPLFLNAFFIHYKDFQLLCRYLKFRCYQCNGKFIVTDAAITAVF